MGKIWDNLYHYKAIVKRVIDGDTIEVDIDWGRNHWDHDLEIRFSRIQCPETYKLATREAGLVAKAFTEAHLPIGSQILIKTFKEGNNNGGFGRLLAEIYLQDEAESNLCDLLLESGNATIYKRR